MLSILIKPLPLLFTLATATGVLLHDTRIDRAASIAFALPTAIIGYAALDSLTSKRGDHVHTDITTGFQRHLKSTAPSMQPRNENDREFIQQKRLLGSDDNDIVWPSV